MTQPVRRIGFLLWPGTRPLTLALAEEALHVAQRVHPEVHYQVLFLQAEPGVDAPLDGAWRLPGSPWAGQLDGLHKLLLVADEPPASFAPALVAALKQAVRGGVYWARWRPGCIRWPSWVCWMAIGRRCIGAGRMILPSASPR